MPDLWVPVKDGKPVALGDLGAVAETLLATGSDLRIWCFEGEVGAGKTTLIKVIGERLGVRETMSSPTFSIINEYRTAANGKLYHFDFYRLKQEQEAFDIGTDEYFDSGNFCFVEWAEKIPNLLPSQHFEIKILPGTDPENRIIAYARHE